jgi:hypothetical protein
LADLTAPLVVVAVCVVLLSIGSPAAARSKSSVRRPNVRSFDYEGKRRPRNNDKQTTLT